MLRGADQSLTIFARYLDELIASHAAQVTREAEAIAQARAEARKAAAALAPSSTTVEAKAEKRVTQDDEQQTSVDATLVAAKAEADAKAAAEAAAEEKADAAAAKVAVQRKEGWAVGTGLLRVECRAQPVEAHDFLHFISNRNAEKYPCVVVKVPSVNNQSAQQGEQGAADDKENSTAQPKRPDSHPMLYEVLYYDRNKEDPVDLEWEAVALDSFVPPPDLDIPVWDYDVEKQQTLAATDIQRRFQTYMSRKDFFVKRAAACKLQYFTRHAVQTHVKRRKAADFATKPVAYRLMVVDEQLETLLELKNKAVVIEDFDDAHSLKLEFERKRMEKDRYLAERDGYLTRIKDLSSANDKLGQRKQEAIAREDYLFAKEIKILMEKNALELADCMRQTNLTDEDLEQMKLNAMKRLATEDKIIRREKQVIMKETATRDLKKFKVFLVEGNQSEEALDSVVESLRKMVEELPSDTQEVAFSQQSTKAKPGADESSAAKVIADGTSSDHVQGGSSEVPKQEEKPANGNQTLSKSDIEYEQRQQQLAEWDQLDAAFDAQLTNLEKLKAEASALQTEVEKSKLSKKEKKSKSKKLKELQKRCKAAEKGLKGDKKAKKERDKERPRLQYYSLFCVLNHEKIKKPKLLKKFIDAGITEATQLLSTKPEKLEKQLSLKAKAIKGLRKIAKEVAKKAKNKKSTATPVKESAKTGTKESSARSSDTTGTRTSTHDSSEGVSSIDQERSPFPANSFVNLARISERSAMVVAFASLERARDHSHFTIPLSGACKQFLAAHALVSRLEVVGDDSCENQAISVETDASSGDPTTINGPAPWSVLESSGDVISGGEEMKSGDTSIESKVVSIEEQRRIRHRQRRRRKASKTNVANTEDSTIQSISEANESPTKAGIDSKPFATDDSSTPTAGDDRLGETASVEANATLYDEVEEHGGSPSRDIESKLKDWIML